MDVARHPWAASVLVVLLAAGCSGGQDVSEEEIDITRPTVACRESFSAATGEENEEASRLDTDERLDTATLLRLPATLDACEGFEDWLAGARAFPDALPAQMDRTSALRLLCDGDREKPACVDLAVTSGTDGST